MACSLAHVPLGNTGLSVAPLGVAAAYGVSGRDVERAYERGLNLFYWGSIRRPDFGRGLKRLAARDRDKIVTVLQSYARWPSAVGSSIERALRSLRTDYTDILLLGWWNLAPPDAILDAAAELVHRGRARAVMVSSHRRPTFLDLARDPRINILMLRYNAAHPGAEDDVFPHLQSPRPAIIGYTATSWGLLVDPAKIPAGEEVPRGSDCYRFTLSNPFIDACFTGPKSSEELDEALAALDRGPMTPDEIAWMKRVGAHVRKEGKLQNRGINLADRIVNFISGFSFRSTSDLGK